MNKAEIEKLLNKVKKGDISVRQAVSRFKHFPLENLEFARVDHHRVLRQGQPEVIYSPGKTREQIVEIARRIRRYGSDVIISRLEKREFNYLKNKIKSAVYYPDARLALILAGRKKKPRKRTDAVVLVCSAGTSDIPVAEEAALTAWAMGCQVERLYDVGVAGIHRLFAGSDKLRSADIIIVVAGMEGALPSVIGGLVDKPIIAVPTSVGYGASFGGLAALLAMLNSCAAGVTVVNIDNGFGAGVAAAVIAGKISKGV